MTYVDTSHAEHVYLVSMAAMQLAGMETCNTNTNTNIAGTETQYMHPARQLFNYCSGMVLSGSLLNHGMVSHFLECQMMSVCRRLQPGLPLMCLPGSCMLATWQLVVNSSPEAACTALSTHQDR